MADESLQLPSDQNIDFHIVTLFERLESIRKNKHLGILSSSITKKVHMHAEVRDIKFWRFVIFFYLFSTDKKNIYLFTFAYINFYLI